MTAHEKIHAFGEKRLAELTGRSLSIIYRWRKALASGEALGVAAMRKLIEATAGSDHAITWADFEPQLPVAA